MAFGKILSGMDISASGLTGERLRMEIAANNIANIDSTMTPEGGPYRRKQVTFAAAMENVMWGGANDVGDLHGVHVVGINEDTTPGPSVHNPSHPHADANGYVQMPNVNIPHEMVDLVTASRAYEANLKSLETFRQMAEQALSLLRGLR
jgi:flagellar basal-body rod protein FlgC